MATTAPQVTIPPPPMPANRPRHGSGARAGPGRAAISASSCASHGLATAANGAVVVTKLGQNPLRHDRSVLQLVGLIRRFRPYAVAIGSIAMQLLCAVQSPQFSQTRASITTRASAAASVPRLRRRRFSVAQTWS